MSKWLKLGTLAALLAVVGLAALGGTAAFAQGPAPQSTAPAYGPGYGMSMGLGGRMGGAQNSLVAVAAKVLGIDQTALVTSLNGGKTIADVAQEKGVSTSKIVDEFLAPREQALKSAVDAKRITQAQADSMLAAMKANVSEQLSSKWSPRGPGLGTGFVDANGDGVCDNYGTNHPAGMMGGFGQRGRWTR
ncbi:MAG: hypothetical protein ACM3JD_16065 [Rudaea sp.]